MYHSDPLAILHKDTNFLSNCCLKQNLKKNKNYSTSKYSCRSNPWTFIASWLLYNFCNYIYVHQNIAVEHSSVPIAALAIEQTSQRKELVCQVNIALSVNSSWHVNLAIFSFSGQYLMAIEHFFTLNIYFKFSKFPPFFPLVFYNFRYTTALIFWLFKQFLFLKIRILHEDWMHSQHNR